MSQVVSRAHQRGVTLIELMIGLTLGLVLLLGVMQVFLASRQTFATNDAMSKLQENGRFALEFMSQSARLGGYLSPGSPLNRPFPAQPVSCGIGTSSTNPCAVNGAGTASDVVAFAFEPPVIDGVRRDCTGTEVAANTVVINTYFIEPATADNPVSSLACRPFLADGTPRAQARLIDGVDALQVLYGIDEGTYTKSANSFVSADRVTNAQWSKVIAVRIAVLANSIDTVTPPPAQRNFYLLDSPPLSFNDNRARQIFTTTIQFKNPD